MKLKKISQIRKYYILQIIICISGFSTASAQVINDRPIKKNSISANILGTGTYVGLSYERLLNNRVIAEIAVGIIGYGLGATVYPLKEISVGQLNPFVGLKYTNHAILDGENKSATYIPIGLSYFSNSRLNFSIDIGPSYFKHKSPGYLPTEEELSRFPYDDFGFWGNMKIGVRF